MEQGGNTRTCTLPAKSQMAITRDGALNQATGGTSISHSVKQRPLPASRSRMDAVKSLGGAPLPPSCCPEISVARHKSKMAARASFASTWHGQQHMSRFVMAISACVHCLAVTATSGRIAIVPLTTKRSLLLQYIMTTGPMGRIRCFILATSGPADPVFSDLQRSLAPLGDSGDASCRSMRRQPP